MIDTVAVKQSVDLVGVIESDLGAGVKRGNRLFWRCPFHSDRDPSLTVFHDPDGDRFRCFGCEAHGDVFDWQQRRQGVTFREAVSQWGEPGYKATPKPATKPISVKQPPDDAWQTAAVRVVLDCEKELWSGQHGAVVDWLAKRGLEPATLRRWMVGFNPKAQELNGLWVPKGVTIPHWHEATNTLWGIKVRQGQGAKQKYMHVKGGTDGMFGADTLAGHDVAVICEGEFDAMLLHAHAGDLVGIVTLGSASSKDVDPWLPHLLPIARLLIATDADQAGDESAAYWLKLTRRARRLRPPVDPKDGKDVTDYWQAGGDLRAWVSKAARSERSSKHDRG